MTETKTSLVSVKWSKKLFKDIEVDPTEPPIVFKSQIWTLSGVPPERQTILGFKGGKLKDDGDWTNLGLKAKMTVIMMGTADESRPAPTPDMPVVRDDLDLSSDVAQEEIASGPPGLINLGNTCYMNATVQCLRAVDPLTTALQEFKGSTSALNPSEKIAASLRDVFSRLRSANSAKVNPMNFLAVLRQVNPQFAERGNNGFFMQQDAEECWGEVLTRLAGSLKVTEGESNHIDRLFAINMKGEDKCEDSEEVVERADSVRALKCHISVSVNHLKQGVSEGLEETIEKTSDQLGRSAKWKRVNRMNTLPPFLIVQFVRFFWKPSQGVKAKILRNVSFPVIFDVHDFCTKELQEQLTKKRNDMQEQKEAGDIMESEPADAPVNAETGHYELCAVLTHQGRAADAGHYVAWVKDKGERWFKFDDDKVTVHTEDEVKKLSGGGDWHMAYMCLYRANNQV